MPVTVKNKFHASGSNSIVGSDSRNSSGDYIANSIKYCIGEPLQRRNKRLLDIVVSILFLLAVPVIIFIKKNAANFYANVLAVLAGKKTWVAYHPLSEKTSKKIPPLRKGVLFATDRVHIENYEEEIIDKVNAIYAQDYKIRNDLQIIFKAFKHLGR